MLRVTGEFFLHHAVIGKRRGLQHKDTVIGRGGGVSSGNRQQASEQGFFHRRVSRRVGIISVAHRA
ncbi:hypothetical protein P262_02498 [Cronobacter malonaticus]|uniref:Uncharacterized protein n=1 Tax=Cronobacter malonaticus TaxID=413503 RepID=V5TY01_9ENTR|nr:hypothetical protein P262_02498 [Cronobacter malonaticus]